MHIILSVSLLFNIIQEFSAECVDFITAEIKITKDYYLEMSCNQLPFYLFYDPAATLRQCRTRDPTPDRPGRLVVLGASNNGISGARERRE